MKNDKKTVIQTLLLDLILPFIYEANLFIFGTGLIFLIIPELIVTSAAYYFIVIRDRSCDKFNSRKKRNKLFILTQVVMCGVCCILAALISELSENISKYEFDVWFSQIVMVWGIFFILTITGGWLLKLFIKNNL